MIGCATVEKTLITPEQYLEIRLVVADIYEKVEF
jgi:hypothetical protein